MVQRPPITTGTVVVLSPHTHSTLISKSVYLLSFSEALTEVLVLRGVVMSTRRRLLSFLLFSAMTRLLAAMVLSVWMGMFHIMVTLSFSVIALGSCSYHRSFTSTPNSLQIFQSRTAGDQMVNGIVETAAKSAFWVHWEALILNCDDKALGFCL